MDNLFDIFNSFTLIGNSNQFLKPISGKSEKHWAFLKEMRDLFANMQVLNKNKNSPPCFSGWVANINGLKLLWCDLETNFQFKYLLTRRLTQDCIENLFSILRGKGGCNITPDASSFWAAIRSTIASQILTPSDDSNCEIDMDQFLLKQNDLKKLRVIINVSHDDNAEDVDTAEYENLDLTMVEINAIENVAGWVCSRIPHKQCREQICSYEDSFNSEQIHILLKKYDDSSKIVYPNRHASALAKQILSVKEDFLCQFIQISRENVKKRLKKEICVANDCPLCEGCQSIFIDKCLNVLINAFIKKENNSLKKYILGKKNNKAAKVLHL
jgi:hypothetical protein